jgi:hypothetical protein
MSAIRAAMQKAAPMMEGAMPALKAGASKALGVANPMLALAGTGAEYNDMRNRFEKGQYGRGVVSGIGALGSAATMIPHPGTKIVGGGTALAAPAINMILDRLMREQDEKERMQAQQKANGGLVHLAKGGRPSISQAYQEVGPVQGPNLGSMLQEHLASLPEKTRQNIEHTNWMVQNSNPYDYTGGKNPHFSYDPKAAEEFANFMPNMMGATAWHGTPHTIKRGFDISKVGTGEGAQAYGHGMYFAENPGVAKGYQDALTNRWDQISIKGEPLQDQMSDIAIAVRNYKDKGGHFSKWKNEVADRMEGAAKNGPGAGNPERAKELLDSANTIRGLKKADIENKGNMYKVDIPDEHIPNMLHWDKPLTEQPKNVQDALKKLPEEFQDYVANYYESQGKNYPLDLPDKFTAGEFFKDAENLAKRFYGEPAWMSETLNQSGVPGVKYLDQGSRGVGEGSHNFVVFDPSKVKILEENSKPFSPLAEGGSVESIESELKKIRKILKKSKK